MLRPGAIVAGHRLEALLGRGGQGEVYRATASDGREVAIKVVATGASAASDAIGRFRREMRLLCSIQHPRVLRAFATGEEQGILWIATELAPQGNLAQHLERCGRMPAANAIAVVGDLIAGLVALAEIGVVHRDVKPANLLGFPDCWKLGDLGMARRFEPDGSNWTSSGMVVGTPAYLAPEVVAGGHATLASDLHAAGCLLHELLTGRPPYLGRDPVAIMRQHLSGPVSDPRRFVADLDQGVAEFALDLMQKEPAHRLADPRRVHERLAQVRAGAGIMGQPELIEPTAIIDIAPTTTLMPTTKPEADPGLAHVRLGCIGRVRLHVWTGQSLTLGRDRDGGGGRHVRVVRLPESEHAAANRRISGRHIAVSFRAGVATIEDLGSGWGTTCDGVRLGRGVQELRDGTRVSLVGVVDLVARVLPGGLLLRRLGNAADLGYLLLGDAVALDAAAQGPGDALHLAVRDGWVALGDGSLLRDGDRFDCAGAGYRVFAMSADDEA
jgi:serine/threonine-protein kinase